MENKPRIQSGEPEIHAGNSCENPEIPGNSWRPCRQFKRNKARFARGDAGKWESGRRNGKVAQMARTVPQAVPKHNTKAQCPKQCPPKHNTKAYKAYKAWPCLCPRLPKATQGCPRQGQCPRHWPVRGLCPRHKITPRHYTPLCPRHNRRAPAGRRPPKAQNHTKALHAPVSKAQPPGAAPVVAARSAPASAPVQAHSSARSPRPVQAHAP